MKTGGGRGDHKETRVLTRFLNPYFSPQIHRLIVSCLIANESVIVWCFTARDVKQFQRRPLVILRRTGENCERSKNVSMFYFNKILCELFFLIRGELFYYQLAVQGYETQKEG